MQMDMHYYGTYALARAAGIKRDAAQIVASAAQFVDDMTGTKVIGKHEYIEFEDGSGIVSRPTAHHANQTSNLSNKDQRHVWVPFHFLPGSQGDDFRAKLQCRMDSPVTMAMVEHHNAIFHKNYGLALAGVTAHVLADTFSHYGFSGICCPRNHVKEVTAKNITGDLYDYVMDKFRNFNTKYPSGIVDNFLTRICGVFANIAALGHGEAATFPDRPYLEWSMEYEYPDELKGKTVIRKNQKTFLQGCKALYDLFKGLAETRPQDSDNKGKPFSVIENAVKAILGVKERKPGRIQAWKRAVKAGEIGPAETIPAYLGEKWGQAYEDFDNSKDSTMCLNHPAYHFIQAASIHRNFILRELLPQHGLIVA